MIVVWMSLLVCGVVGASFASRRAVTSALRITESMNISPALVGVTVMAIGTDLPEIANSIVSSASGHGDINVGDSMGSVVTQVTLVLGLLFLTNSDVKPERNVALSVGLAALVASVMVLVLIRDRELSHVDGLILVLLWLAGTTLLGHGEMGPHEPGSGNRARTAADITSTLLWLGVVGVFAVAIVRSFLEISDSFGIPEFIGSFIALSIGTSLPELVVDWTAIRRGASAMAVGDVFGSSFVDATLSVGIGPMIFGSRLSAEVFSGVALAAVGVLLATVLVARAARYDWRLGLTLLALYGGVQTSAALVEL